MTNSKPVKKLNYSIKSIAFIENDTLAIKSCNNDKIVVYNITNQSVIKTLNDHTNCVNTLLLVKVLIKICIVIF